MRSGLSLGSYRIFLREQSCLLLLNFIYGPMLPPCGQSHIPHLRHISPEQKESSDQELQGFVMT